MSDNDGCFINSLSSTTLRYIFLKLPFYDFMQCRVVCSKWRAIIDKRTRLLSFWRIQCRKDFPDACESAAHLSWYHLYRSLTLWSKIQLTRDYRKYIAKSQYYKQDNKNCVLLTNNIIAIHKNTSITFYNRDTLKRCSRPKIKGEYVKYIETDEMMTCLDRSRKMSITWKSLSYSEPQINVGRVKLILVLGRLCFYVKDNNQLCRCKLLDDERTVSNVRITYVPFGVAALSIQNGSLYVLAERNIYKLDGYNLMPVMIFDKFSTNMYQELRKYNFLKEINWLICFNKYAIVKNDIHLRSHYKFTVIFSYGRVTFAGTDRGKLYIFRTSDISNFSDLFTAEPLKVYNFVKKRYRSLQTKCRIHQVKIVEYIDSHILYVIMSSRVSIVTITQEWMRTDLITNSGYSSGSES